MRRPRLNTALRSTPAVQPRTGRRRWLSGWRALKQPSSRCSRRRTRARRRRQQQQQWKQQEQEQGQCWGLPLLPRRHLRSKKGQQAAGTGEPRQWGGCGRPGGPAAGPRQQLGPAAMQLLRPPLRLAASLAPYPRQYRASKPALPRQQGTRSKGAAGCGPLYGRCGAGTAAAAARSRPKQSVFTLIT